jgi:hypothetical protein
VSGAGRVQLTRVTRRGALAVGVWLAVLPAGLVGAQVAGAAAVVFNSAGAEQTFTVPLGVTSVHVVAIGGKGGVASDSRGGAGGFGASASSLGPQRKGPFAWC